MKAMILAAGIGSRLKPITHNRPKALVELFGKSLLQIQLEKLQKAGITDVVINVHHFAEQVIEYLKQNNDFGMNIHISDESKQLLDTGGAVKKAAAFFGDEDFLLQNVDVVSDIDLNELLAFHLKQSNEVTLAVSDRKTSRYLLFDSKGHLCGWKNIAKNEVVYIPGRTAGNYDAYAFSGIHIIKPSIFTYFPTTDSFSIVDFYLSTANYYSIRAYQHPAENWWDIGKADDFATLSSNKKIEKIINL